MYDISRSSKSLNFFYTAIKLIKQFFKVRISHVNLSLKIDNYIRLIMTTFVSINEKYKKSSKKIFIINSVKYCLKVLNSNANNSYS